MRCTCLFSLASDSAPSFCISSAFSFHPWLFPTINHSPLLKLPAILFMTATADLVMLRQLERITGYRFQESNIFWPSATEMAQRRQAIWYTPTTMTSSILRPLTKPCFGVSSSKKFIVYVNSTHAYKLSSFMLPIVNGWI